MSAYILREDGTGDLELEDGSGDILQEGTAPAAATLGVNIAFSATGNKNTDARVSQVAVEAAMLGAPTGRVSQEAIEVAVQHDGLTHVGLSQLAVEVLIPAPSYAPIRQVIFVGPLSAPS